MSTYSILLISASCVSGLSRSHRAIGPGIRRTDPNYFSGIVTNAVLSGYSGRLNQEIRIKRGLSYGARSQLDVRRETGPFVASAQTKNPSGAEVAALRRGSGGLRPARPRADFGSERPARRGTKKPRR